ncbi:MAG: substrate-binding domain-containing protein [Armatimonadaceae bacterium]
MRRRDIVVPEQIRVVGCDNHHAARWFVPPFPTTDPDFSRLGQCAIDMLDQRIAGGHRRPRTLVLPVPVLWRDGSEPVENSFEKGGYVPSSV